MKDIPNSPTFLDVIMSANYDPCPCGHHFGVEDVSVIKRHYFAGHYDTEWWQLYRGHITTEKKVKS